MPNISFHLKLLKTFTYKLLKDGINTKIFNNFNFIFSIYNAVAGKNGAKRTNNRSPRRN